MKKGIYLLVVILFMFTACKGNKSHEDPNPFPVIPQKTSEQSSEPNSICVYIDNSGSMRGYTEGENSVFINAVSDLKSLKNGYAYFWGAKPKKPIEGIIGKALKENHFSGLDSPFPVIFAQLEREANQSNALTFIVTDGIIGVSSKEAQYLKNSLGQIKNDIRDSIKLVKDIAISVFRLQSGYTNKDRKSYYYTNKNTPVKLDSANQRPFFVIAIGRRPHVQWLLDKVNSDESLGCYKKASKITFGLHEHEPKLSFSDKLSFEQKSGYYKLTRKKGEFNLKADLPECLIKDLGEKYIKDNLEVLLNGSKNNIIASLSGNSLCLNCNEIRNISSIDNIITVRLKKNIPTQWMTNWSSEDDSNIAKDQNEQVKTFALSYLLQGIYEATDGGKMLIDTEFKFKK